MIRLLMGLSAALAALALLSPAGLAQAEASCGGVGDVPMTDPIGVARIGGTTGRLHFVLGTAAGRSECPAPTPKCRMRAFLMPGDVVLTRPGPVKGHVCASFVNAKGVETVGWLPAERLVAVPPAPLGEAQWLGTWQRTEATIKIVRGQGGALTAEGEATWGAGDKRRVAMGAVNTGEFSGPIRRAGEIGLVADGSVASFEAASRDACAVRLRRIGPYLLVEDNRSCGGMNVSFSGLYVRG